MKVIVIGAGVAGVAAALSLTRAGHEVELYERAGEPRVGGYGVILWSNATGILAELGLPIDTLGGHRLDRVDIQSDQGRTLVRVDLDRVAGRLGSVNAVLRRTELVRHLSDQLPDGVIRFGYEIVDIKEPVAGTGNPVVVTFADGRTAEGDVLIGADGHRSYVRRHLFGESVARPTGWATWHGTTRLADGLLPDHRVRTLATTDGLCVMHPLGENLLYWAFETPWREGDLVPPPMPGEPDPATGDYSAPSAVANLRSRFGGFAAPVPQLLDSITDDDIGLFPHILHRVPRQWGRGPVSLVGDAAHAVPPRTGMGANQALEDAWVLGKVFAEEGEPAMLLRRYERARQRYVRRLFMYATFTGSQGQALPGLFRMARDGVSFTGFQRAQIKAFSNYLNGATGAVRAQGA